MNKYRPIVSVSIVLEILQHNSQPECYYTQLLWHIIAVVAKLSNIEKWPKIHLY